MKVEEVEITRRSLHRIAAASALVAVLAVLLTVGAAASPRDAAGHPLLLTPERQAILRYLRLAGGWAQQLEDVAERLDRLSPAGELSPGGFPAATPATAPGDLYQRAHEAQAALDALTALAAEVERARVPAPLSGLHERVTTAVQAHVEWASGVQRTVGVPSADPAGLDALRGAAADALQGLREALNAR